MRKEVYVCDHYGKVFHSIDPYVLDVPYTLKVETITVQDRLEGHYCSDCWKVVKDGLTNKSDEAETFKKENERLKKDIKWYERFTASIIDAFAESFINPPSLNINKSKNSLLSREYTIKNSPSYSSPYTSYTINTSGEKTIQAKPMNDGPFTIGCCCENTNKDSLDYKQIVGMI